AEVKLIHNKVIECRRSEALIMPWIGIRASYDAIAVRITGDRQFARPGIAFETGCLFAGYEIAILRAIHNAGEKACPVSCRRMLDEFVGRFWLVSGSRIQHYVHMFGIGSPYAKRGAITREGGSHRR